MNKLSGSREHGPKEFPDCSANRLWDDVAYDRQSLGVPWTATARKALPSNSQRWPNCGLTDAGRVRQHCIEDRLEFARRTGDDLQHFGGRGLLLQRLREIIGALTQLVEQPRVLDGDDGLGGEVLHQLDLLIGERDGLLGGKY